MLSCIYSLGGPAPILYLVFIIWLVFEFLDPTLVLLRGLVQSPYGKINVIMTLTFYPPPTPLLTSQHFRQDSALKSLNLNERNCVCESMSVQLLSECALLL